MDSPSSTPDGAPEPREATLASVAEQVAAIDEIVGYARTRLQVFDVDMSSGGWQRAARVDALGRVLRGVRGARCEVILHDLRWLESASGRLLATLRQFPHAVTIYRAGPEARAAMDPLVIVDRQHCLHRFHVERPRAWLAVSQPGAIKPLCTRFDEIWATGEPGLSSSVLGLR
jgi:hypothetical protein